MKKYLKYIIFLALIIIFVIGLNVNKTTYLKGIYNIEININDYGSIYLELDADNSPITVTNFISLVNDRFYDGLTFHRIIDGFMIQGGDPLGNGTGGSQNKIKGEFSENGIKNNILHKRGVISMARSSDYDSASSQFFIMQQDNSNLDGLYASFGKVTEGIEIVDDIISNVAQYGDENGLIKEEFQPKINYIKVIE